MDEFLNIGGIFGRKKKSFEVGDRIVSTDYFQKNPGWTNNTQEIKSFKSSIGEVVEKSPRGGVRVRYIDPQYYPTTLWVDTSLYSYLTVNDFLQEMIRRDPNFVTSKLFRDNASPELRRKYPEVGGDFGFFDNHKTNENDMTPNIHRFGDYRHTNPNLNEGLREDLGDKVGEKYAGLKKDLLDRVETSVDDPDQLANVQNFLVDATGEGAEVELDGLVDDADVFEFYLGHQGDVDDILMNADYFEEVPKDNNVFSLYDGIIVGTRRAVQIALEAILEDAFGRE